MRCPADAGSGIIRILILSPNVSDAGQTLIAEHPGPWCATFIKAAMLGLSNNDNNDNDIIMTVGRR